jgi:polyhydroxybutyrate depolymerase
MPPLALPERADEPIALRHDGLDRPYRLYTPHVVTPPEVTAPRLPLIIQLHGRGGGGPWFDRLVGFVARAPADGFAVAMPEAVGGIWNDGRRRTLPGAPLPDDVGYLATLLDDAVARRRVDPRRVYVVGMSNGASMAGRLACEIGDRLAAVAQVAGTAWAGAAADCRPRAIVPILQIHGTADPYWPYAGGAGHGLRRRLLLRSAPASVAVDDWARLWVTANGANLQPAVTRLLPDTTIRSWHGPTPASDVVFYRVRGGGHTWPGGSLEPRTLFRLLWGRTSRTFRASDVIWSFFAVHSR